MKEIWQDSHNPGKSPNIPNLNGPLPRPTPPPRRGWYKINTDGALFKESGCYGIGLVIRNKEGCMMGAMSKQIKLPLKVLETEALVVQEGIGLAWDLGMKEIEIESDS